jgi:elongation factor Ts
MNQNPTNPTPQGKIELYSHNNGRIGVMVEINTQNEAVQRLEAFDNLAREMALQITAAAPLYVGDTDIPQAVLDELAQTAVEKARQAGKPERVIAKIVDGVLEKYKNQHVLLRQLYIRDENITVAQLLEQSSTQLGEDIVIRRFLRWEVTPEAKNDA